MSINLREVRKWAALAKALRQEEHWLITAGAKRLGWLELRRQGERGRREAMEGLQGWNYGFFSK